MTIAPLRSTMEFIGVRWCKSRSSGLLMQIRKTPVFARASIIIDFHRRDPVCNSRICGRSLKGKLHVGYFLRWEIVSKPTARYHRAIIFLNVHLDPRRHNRRVPTIIAVITWRFDFYGCKLQALLSCRWQKRNFKKVRSILCRTLVYTCKINFRKLFSNYFLEKFGIETLSIVIKESGNRYCDRFLTRSSWINE